MKTVFDSNSDKFNSVDDYRNATKAGLAAKDISANTFTVKNQKNKLEIWLF